MLSLCSYVLYYSGDVPVYRLMVQIRGRIFVLLLFKFFSVTVQKLQGALKQIFGLSVTSSHLLELDVWGKVPLYPALCPLQKMGRSLQALRQTRESLWEPLDPWLKFRWRFLGGASVGALTTSACAGVTTGFPALRLCLSQSPNAKLVIPKG